MTRKESLEKAFVHHESLPSFFKEDLIIYLDLFSPRVKATHLFSRCLPVMSKSHSSLGADSPD